MNLIPWLRLPFPLEVPAGLAFLFLVLAGVAVGVMSFGSHRWKVAAGFVSWAILADIFVTAGVRLVSTLPDAPDYFVAIMGVSMPTLFSYLLISLFVRLTHSWIGAGAEEAGTHEKPKEIPQAVKDALAKAKMEPFVGVNGRAYALILSDFPMMEQPTALERQRRYLEENEPELLLPEEQRTPEGWRFWGIK